MAMHRSSSTPDGSDVDFERTLALMTEILDFEEPLPTGLRSRLEAAVDVAFRKHLAISWGAVTLVGSITFITVCVAYPGVFSVPFLIVALATAVLYGLVLRWLVREVAAAEE